MELYPYLQEQLKPRFVSVILDICGRGVNVFQFNDFIDKKDFPRKLYAVD